MSLFQPLFLKKHLQQQDTTIVQKKLIKTHTKEVFPQYHYSD
jgi:hypothetical protein